MDCPQCGEEMELVKEWEGDYWFCLNCYQIEFVDQYTD